jgi:hypothetical protein
MSAYKLEELIRLWTAEKVSVEQAIGQILLLIKERDGRLRELERRIRTLRQALDGGGGRGTRQASGKNKPVSGA